MDKRQAAFDSQATQADFGDIFRQTDRRAGVFGDNTGPPPERRSTISNMMPCRYQIIRMRNLSGGSNGSTASGSSSGSSTQLDNQYSDQQQSFPLEISLFSNNSPTLAVERGSSTSHRKLDRSWSDTDSDRNGSQKSVNSSRYKTELCRPFEESGSCKYGDKCQFAHGYHELRNVTRHPKYKTELCRTFHTTGFCPYGPRCHFIHEEETKPAEASPKVGRAGSMQSSSSGSSSPSLSPSGSDDFKMFLYHPETSSQMSRTTNVANHNLNGQNTNTNSGNYNLHALERHFSNIKLNCGSINNNTSIFNSNQKPQLIGSEERDIFSEITMFNSEDVFLDNASTSMSSCAAQSMKLDNFPFVDNRAQTYWQSSYADGY